MPNAIDNTAIAVKSGTRRSVRTAYRRSARTWVMCAATATRVPGWFVGKRLGQERGDAGVVRAWDGGVRFRAGPATISVGVTSSVAATWRRREIGQDAGAALCYVSS